MEEGGFFLGRLFDCCFFCFFVFFVFLFFTFFDSFDFFFLLTF